MLFLIDTGIHNMLKYKHNTFKRKNKVYTKAFYKNKWYVKRYKLLDENDKLRTYLKLKCNFDINLSPNDNFSKLE
jgi:hypothetical protein